MTMTEKIFTVLSAECKLNDEAEVHRYVMNRRQQSLKQHIDNVFPIKEPGERGGDPKKFFTKLTPKNRNHDGKIRANTREELEEKIIAFYLQIQNDENVTVKDILLRAVDENTKTGKRTIQRFEKRLSDLSKIKLNNLDEKAIRKALENVAFPKDKDGKIIEEKKFLKRNLTKQ